MFINHYYHRDERLTIRVAVVSLVVLTVVTIFLTQVLGASREQILPEDAWPVIYQFSKQADLDPEFVYALAHAESGLNAKASSSVARGMMQLTRPAWNEVTDEPYHLAWKWQMNIRVGIDYLAYCRDFLELNDAFTYPLLAASYRYGPYHVAEKDFNIKKLERPKNEIYKRIFMGNMWPVQPPSMKTAKSVNSD